MKMIRYIIAAVASLLVWSCSYSDLDTDDRTGGDGMIQVVPRVMPFGDVDTRSNKTAEEQRITSLAMTIFDAAGTCISFQYKEGSSPSFLIDPDRLEELNPSSDLSSSSVYAFANMPQLSGLSESEWKGKTLSYFMGMKTDVTGVDIPAEGFPMMGGRTDVNLDPDGELNYLVTLEMLCSYAKVTVNIGVNSPLDLSTGHNSTFLPSVWEVYNVSSKVDFIEDTESAPSVLDEVFSSKSFDGFLASSSNTVSFSFYLPERLVAPANDPDYPFVEAHGGVLRPEDEHLRQRYKPTLVTPEQKATYVRIHGTFSDHHGHRKTIYYDIYVGENNYDDFNVRRNIEYINNITIKSATNDSSVEYDHEVSYDARVTFEDKDHVVRVERETLLDAHFEVLPIRIHVKQGSTKVRIKDPDSVPWIRLEEASEKRDYFTENLLSELSANVSYTLGAGDHCIWVYVDENVSQTKDGVRTAVIEVTHYDISGNRVGDPMDYTIAQRYLYPVNYEGRNYSIEYHEEYLHNYDPEAHHGETEFEGMPWGLENMPLSKKNRAIVFDTGGGWFSDIIDSFINSNVGEVSPFYDFYLPRDIGTNTALTARSYSGHTFVEEITTTLKESDATFGRITLDEDPRSAIEYCYNKNKRNASGEVESMHWYLPAIDEMEEIAIGGYGVFKEFQNKYYWSCQPAYIQNRAHYHNLADQKGVYYSDDYGYYYVQSGEGVAATVQEYDGPGYARATKVNFADGNYAWASSGVSGFKEIFEIPGNGEPKVYVVPNKYSYSYWWSTITFEESTPLTRQEGNQPRTKQNRIRCVYKP